MGPTEMYRETAERFEVAEDVREWHTAVRTQRLSLFSSSGVSPTSEVRVAFVLLTEKENVQSLQQGKASDMQFVPNCKFNFI